MLRVNGVCTLIKVIKEDTDKNGDTWASFSGVFRSSEGDQFVIVKAFKSQAEFILRNLGESPRRVDLSGRMSIQEQTKKVKIEKKVKLGNEGKVYKVPFEVDQKESVVVILVSDLEFIDKKKDGVLDAEEISVSDDEVVVVVAED